jgi:hypothetical protein
VGKRVSVGVCEVVRDQEVDPETGSPAGPGATRTQAMR